MGMRLFATLWEFCALQWGADALAGVTHGGTWVSVRLYAMSMRRYGVAVRASEQLYFGVGSSGVTHI